MSRAPGIAFAGVGLAVAGAMMVLSAIQSYLTGIPRTPSTLYIFVPIGVALLVPGLVLLVRAFSLAIEESKEPPRALPPEST